MRLHILLVLFAGLLLAADAPKADATKKDMELFQGAWSLVAIEQNGEKVPDDKLTNVRLLIEGNKRILKERDRLVTRSTFRLDASKNPRWIDVTVQAGGELTGKTLHGIYEIDGDTQKICFSLQADERPRDFTARQDSGRLLQVFKRLHK